MFLAMSLIITKIGMIHHTWGYCFSNEVTWSVDVAPCSETQYMCIACVRPCVLPLALENMQIKTPKLTTDTLQHEWTSKYCAKQKAKYKPKNVVILFTWNVQKSHIKYHEMVHNNYMYIVLPMNMLGNLSPEFFL